MVKKRDKNRAFIIAGAALLVLIALVGTISLINGLNSGKSDPYKQTETTQPDDTSTSDQNTSVDTDSSNTSTTDPDTSTGSDASTDATPDPSTLSTIDITPMSITVSYVKGIGGFEYSVSRAARGTQYVAFSSPELVGTKCTDDKGEFATILADPSSDESATVSKSVTVEGVKYGLSLTAANCTKDPELLKKYQTSFSDAFGLLKKKE